MPIPNFGLVRAAVVPPLLIAALAAVVMAAAHALAVGPALLTARSRSATLLRAV